MKNASNRIALTVLASTFLLTAVNPSLFAQDPAPKKESAKQDVKDAGTDTKNATKKTGHAIAKGTKTAAVKTKNGTETAAKDTGHGTKVAAEKTKNGTKKVIHGTAKGTKKAADKVEDKTSPQ